MNKFTYTTQKQLRAAFWTEHPHFDEQARAAGIRSKGQNAQSATVRCAWCDWLDGVSRAGDCSPELAERATL